MSRTRIIICGGRDFRARELCFGSLDEILTQYQEIEIISGGASGADAFGEEYAAAHGLPVTQFKPDWKRYGKVAGPIRNREMLQYALKEQAVVIAFWDESSHGTRDMIRKAEDAGEKVLYYRSMSR